MFCMKCGSKINAGERSCGYCGAAVPAAGGRRGHEEEHSGRYHEASGSSCVINSENRSGGLSIRAASILCYWFGLIGWLISYLTADHDDPYLRFHLNQSLALFLFSLGGLLPVIGWIWGIFIFSCWLIAVIGAFQGEARNAPFFFPKIHLLN